MPEGDLEGGFSDFLHHLIEVWSLASWGVPTCLFYNFGMCIGGKRFFIVRGESDLLFMRLSQEELATDRAHLHRKVCISAENQKGVVAESFASAVLRWAVVRKCQ